MTTLKTQAVCVRVEHIKAALQTAACREMRSLTNMFEVMVLEHAQKLKLKPAAAPAAKPAESTK